MAVPAPVPLEVSPSASALAQRIVPAGTAVDFEILDHINSKLSHIGDRFSIRLISPILFDGKVAVPVGTLGQGEIIHAARARAAGKAGELILAVRYLDWSGQQIGLRGFRFGVSGQSNRGTAIAVAVAAGMFSYLVVGGEVDVPPGTVGSAKTKEDLILSIPGKDAPQSPVPPVASAP